MDHKSRLYELRTCYACEGKLDALIGRFRQHTIGYFNSHHIQPEAFWVPCDNQDKKLIYLVSYADDTARNRAWTTLRADQGWQHVVQETNKEGNLVRRNDSVKLFTTGFSPDNLVPVGNRIFRLRTYQSPKGRLPDLLRLAGALLPLFERHKMTNIMYWTLGEKEADADTTLIYLLAHASIDDAKASFCAFRKDPDWVQAKEQAIRDAGGPVTATVNSVYLTPLSFSPLQ